MERCNDTWCHRYNKCYYAQAQRLPGDTDMTKSSRSGGTFCNQFTDVGDAKAAILEAERRAAVRQTVGRRL